MNATSSVIKIIYIMALLVIVQCKIFASGDAYTQKVRNILSGNKYIDLDGQFKMDSSTKNVMKINLPECSHSILALESCTPSVCVSQHGLYNIMHKINGKTDQGMCHYNQISERYGGIECFFPANETKNINLILDAELSSEEKTQHNAFSAIIAKYCKIIKKTIHNIDVNTMYSEPQDSEFYKLDVISEDMKFEKKKVRPSIAKTKVRIKPRAKTKVFDITKTSLMFFDSHYQNILNAAKYLSSLSGAAPGSVGYSKKSKGISFYLNSILYIDENNWVVWINEEKISSGNQKHPFLFISDITKEYAVIKWTTNDLSLKHDNWQENMIYEGKGIYRSGDNLMKVKEDESSGFAEVSFTLYANQTFDVSKFYIIEGE